MALGELLVSAIDAPPSGAGVGSDTTPVSGRPPGNRGEANREGELADRQAPRCGPRPNTMAVIVADVGVAEAPMSIGNVWIVLPERHDHRRGHRRRAACCWRARPTARPGAPAPSA